MQTDAKFQDPLYARGAAEHACIYSTVHAAEYDRVYSAEHAEVLECDPIKDVLLYEALRRFITDTKEVI